MNNARVREAHFVAEGGEADATGVRTRWLPCQSQWTLTEVGERQEDLSFIIHHWPFVHLWKETSFPSTNDKWQMMNPPLFLLDSSQTPGRQWLGAGGESAPPCHHRNERLPVIIQSSRATTILSAQRYIKAIRMMMGIGTPRK